MLVRALAIVISVLSAPICQARDDVSFKKSNLLLPDGSMQDAELVFMPDQHLIAVRCLYQGGIRIPYDKVVSLMQSLSERRVNTTAVALTGVGGLLFTRSRQHYLYINYEEDGAVRQIGLRLDKSEWQRVVEVAHAETGKTVEVAGSAGPPPPAPPPLPAAAGSETLAFPSQPPRSATHEPASLTITSVPSGAEIQVNGEFLGSTPSKLKLEPGNHTVVVEKKGHTRWERSLTLSAGSSITLDAVLKPSQTSASATAMPATPVAAPVPPVEEMPATAQPAAMDKSSGQPRSTQNPVEADKVPASGVQPIRAELDQPIAIPASGIEIILTKVVVAVGSYQGMRPLNRNAKPENDGVLAIVGRTIKGNRDVFSTMDKWVSDEEEQRNAKEDMSGLANGQGFTLLFSVPRNSRKLRLHVGESLAIDLAAFLQPSSSAAAKPATAPKPSLPTAHADSAQVVGVEASAPPAPEAIRAPAPSAYLTTSVSVKGSKGGEGTMTITLGAGGETSMSLKWARCARDEEFKSNGVSLRFGEKALCRDVELANYDAPVRGAMFLLAEGDVMPNAVKKRIPPQGKPSIEISGDLAASRQGGKLEARPNYRSIIGTIAGEPVDAVLERKSDVYYAVLDKTGTPLSTVFIIRQGEQTVRYHLRGLSVKPDGKLDVDAEVLLAPGESITVNTEKQKD